MATTATISETDLTTLLSRLSSKQSVQSLLILSRATGAIIRSSGAITRENDEAAAEYARAVYCFVKASEQLVGALEAVDAGRFLPGGGEEKEKEKEKGKGKEEGEEEGRRGDDVRLMRVRTGRRELVVVPDPKFILIVFHDTPAAP